MTAAEYHVLMCAFSGKGTAVAQTNYYYDTPELDGNARGITYRIREKNGKFTATVKSHCVTGNGGSTEYSGEAQAWDDISFFDVPELVYQGFLTTERLIVRSSEHVEISIDKNRYFHFTDHELELEYREGAENEVEKTLRLLADILQKNGLPVSFPDLICRLNACRSKSARFFARKARVEEA